MGVSDLQIDTNAGKWLGGCCFFVKQSDGSFILRLRVSALVTS